MGVKKKQNTRVCWKINCRARPEIIYDVLNSADGRTAFWAESAEEQAGVIHFVFSNGQSCHGKIIRRARPKLFVLDYFQSTVSFVLRENTTGGTEVILKNSGLQESAFLDHYAGWVSVLLALKAWVDFQVDLRNHDPTKTWTDWYVDN